MNTILLTTLATVVLVGIPFGIFLGWVSAKKQAYVKATIEDPPADSSAGETTQKVVHKERYSSSATWSPLSTILSAGLPLVLAVLIVGGFLYLVQSGIIPEDWTQGPIDWLSERKAQLEGLWSTSTGIGVAILLFILSLFLPDEPKAVKYMKRLLFLAAILVALFTFFSSGFGAGAARTIERTEACIGYQDCGPRADDIPIIDGGTLRIPKDGHMSFFAVGKVALVNYANYCLNISPSGVFEITWSKDVRRVYIKPKSGKRELATVTSLRLGSEDC